MALPDLARSAVVALPYTQAFSRSAGSSSRRRRYAAERARLEAVLADGLSGVAWRQRKTYLSILVEKPFHNSDAINVVDRIADAVKRAIRVDDNWFCLLRVDWLIVKQNPRIYVTVGQEEGGDQVACSVCGQLKGPAEMTSRGKHSECRLCNAEIGAARYRALGRART